MNTTKLLRVSVILLIILNLLTIGSVFLKKEERHPHRNKPNHKHPKEIIIQKLQLDAQQQKEYELLIEEHRTAIDQIEHNRARDKEALYQLLNQEEHPQKDSILNQLKHHQLAIEETHFNHFLAIRKLCKAEQLNDFENLSKELGRLFRKGPHKRH